MSESCSASSLSTLKYGIPSEIRPVSLSEDSEEESFVVLGKSLIPDNDDTPSGEIDPPICSAVFNDAKQLIQKELQEIENLSLKPKDNKKNGDCVQDGHTSFANEKSIQSMTNSRLLGVMQSSDLPQMPEVNKGFDTTNTISVTTFSTEFSSDEVQNKISQIIEENIHLKDTILQNNMSMKSQYERIVAWQEEVQKVHQAHKEKILEAKEIIEKLKEEISNLTGDADRLKQVIEEQNQELTALKSAKEKGSETNNLKDVISNLTNETDRLKQIIDMQNQELITVKNIMKEKEKLTDQKLVESSDNNMKAFELDVANNKIKELEKSLQNMNLENSTLKSENEKLSADSSEVNKQHEKIKITLEQLQQVEKELEAEKASAAMKEKSLNDVIADLRAKLTNVAKQQTDQPSHEELSMVKTQLANAQIILTQVEQTRATAYSQMHIQNQEIERLNKEIEGMQKQAERVKDERVALEMQLDVYKADFEAERSAREAMKEEKDNIAEDLQNLQRRNQHLQEEIDVIRENRGFHVFQRRDPPAPSAPTSALKCPKCNFGFTTLQALENHVYRCIDLDDNLP